MKRGLLALLCLLCASPAFAHKASDSYLALEVAGQRIGVQWDIALRDLELAVGLDVNHDGAITWGELRARHAAIADYAQPRLVLHTGDAPCAPTPAALLVDRHSDGAYAVLRYAFDCPAVRGALAIRYSLLFELDAQHRGLARVSHGSSSQALIFSPAHAAQTLVLGATSATRVLGDYLREGVHHIAIGYDHILFLVSLLLPCVLYRENGRQPAVAQLRSAAGEAVRIVTAFTLAHSVTLALAALWMVALPSRWVESLIALSVLVVALNNLRPFLPGRAWRWAAGFGLLHGLGFASVLGDLGLPAGARVIALAGFNLGVEFGQLAIVVVLLPLVFLLRASAYYRLALPAGSLAIGGIALVWFVERAFDLRLV